MRTYYEILNVTESALGPEIDAAYRHVRSDPACSLSDLTDIDAAYYVLSNADRRARYDEELISQGRRGGASGAAAELKGTGERVQDMSGKPSGVSRSRFRNDLWRSLVRFEKLHGLAVIGFFVLAGLALAVLLLREEWLGNASI